MNIIYILIFLPYSLKMQNIKFLLKLYKFKDSTLSGSELLDLMGEFYSYPKSLKIRNKLLDKNVIIYSGPSKKDKRVKLYKLANLPFDDLAKKFSD